MTEIKINGYVLDEEQRKPILENTKYQLIIAGAGTGKTLTLVGKIKYVLEKGLYKPEEICCISFTNESIKDLEKNIFKNCSASVPVFTFHKLSLLLLERFQLEYQIAPANYLNDVIDLFFQEKCFGNSVLQDIIYRKYCFFPFHDEKTWQRIIQSPKFTVFKKNISTFLSLMYSNDYQKKDFKTFFQKNKYQDILLIIYAISIFYESEKKIQGFIDFDDMLILATKQIKEKGCPLPFKLILIDEFQDTSFTRFHLILEMVRQNDASLCVVGDDYQSIYHFSGCDLSLFLQFEDFFPNAKKYALTKTYRNSKELVQTAGKFIQKNPQQIKKELTSDKHLEKPIIYVSTKNKNTVLKKIINSIPEDQEILILGRNHFDLKYYTKNFPYVSKENNYIEFPNLKERKIRYLTIHSSKGLESDVVILLNVENSLHGIPTKVKEENILSFVKKEMPFSYEEERRLFYVALTRTKSYIYLIVPEQNPSCFLKDLERKNIRKIRM